MSSIYYVYLFKDENGLPFYVGKGKGNRYKDHFQKKELEKSNHKSHKIKKMMREGYEIDIEFIKNLTEKEAFSIEKKLINKYGRKDNKTGILTNLTDGGEGISGKIFTEEEKMKISKRVSGKNNPNYGRKHTEEAKKMISYHQTGKRNNFYGKKHTEEWKQNMSNIQTKRSFYEISSTGDVLNIWDSVTEFSRVKKLQRSSVYQSLKNYSCKIQGNYLREIDYPVENGKVKDIKKFLNDIDNKHKKKTIQKTLEGKIIKIWNSRKEIVQDLNLNFSSLSTAITKCKPYYGFLWENE